MQKVRKIMEDKIYRKLHKSTGNCGCFNCGKRQEGFKLHPYTVWYKFNDETRGHNCPMCSEECADRFILVSLPTIKRIKL